jgi:hypothetical protein
MTDEYLREQLQGVTPPSDPPTEEQPIEDEYLEPNEPTEDADDGDDGESSEGGQGRPAENYYRELIRKSEEREERMLQMMERIADSSAAVRSEPVKKSGDSLDDRSVEELEGLRDQVPEDRRSAFDAYLNKRRVTEEVESRMSALEQRTEVRTARQGAGQEAVNRYPDLADPTSDFAKKVNAKLRTLGRQYIDANPRAIVDVANEVAITEGRQFRSQPGRRPKGSQANRSSTPVDNESRGAKGKQFQSKEETAKIAERLSRALPRGKKFDIDKINERANEYDQNRDLFIK